MSPIHCVRRLRFLFLGILVAWQAAGSDSAAGSLAPIHHQWDVIELTFAANSIYENPFDYTHFAFVTVWTAPNGHQYRMPGFWDGGTVWKNRFMPTQCGAWHYETQFQVAQDSGLNGKSGEVWVEVPEAGCTALKRHGGILKASKNGRSLTYSDGTPFFWLGDTWFRFPSSQIPLDFFKAMVDQRVGQHYTVFSGHGSEAMVVGGARPMEAILPQPAAMQYWKTLDPYMSYAANRGMVAMIGYGAHSMLDAIPEPTLKTFFHYHLARYGALPVSYFFTQEYNAAIGDPAVRTPKLSRLGQYIKDIDPYHRALTLHPWIEYKDSREAWTQPWYDMIWLQAGHFMPPKPELITPAYSFSPAKPVIQAEHNFEGFVRGTQVDTDTSVRGAAYTTFQAGGAGYTYGAQGLYAGVMNRSDPLTTAVWGPVLTSEEALKLPGGNQMRYVAEFYQSLHWWELEPKPLAVERHPEILVKASGAEAAVYFPPRKAVVPQAFHLNVKHAKRSTILGRWFNPRNGKVVEQRFAVDSDGRIVIHGPPSGDDWLLKLVIGARPTPQSGF